jgi:hypothetical protein
VKTKRSQRRPRRTGVQIGFAIFVVLCLIAVGWRVLRPVLWPRLHHETPKQTSTRMFEDNSFLH